MNDLIEPLKMAIGRMEIALARAERAEKALAESLISNQNSSDSGGIDNAQKQQIKSTINAVLLDINSIIAEDDDNRSPMTQGVAP